MNKLYEPEYRLLHLTDIPAIDLYVDQVISILSEFLPVERPLTKSMINNYSKEGLISQVHGKRYNKDHIIQIYLICIMKEVLSMQEIKQVMKAFSCISEWESVYQEFYERRMSLSLKDLDKQAFSTGQNHLQKAKDILLLSSLAGDMKLSVCGFVAASFPEIKTKK